MKLLKQNLNRHLQTWGLVVLLVATALPSVNAQTQVVMLGTGTPVHNPERSGPAVAVVVDDKSYLFDFGPGVVRRAGAMSPRFGGNIQALDAGNLNVAFLTHLHSDHTAGFPDLLLTGWSSGKRKVRLKLYGPDGIDALVKGTNDAYLDDIKYRLYNRGKAGDEGWRVETQVVKEGLVYADESIRVIAFPVVHGAWPNAFGYRIETEDKVIVYSGDLSPNEKIREYSKDADYLIHEVYCDAGVRVRSEADQRYHGTNHTSTFELAKLANEVKPGVLVLNHVLFFTCSEDELMKEVKDKYKGKVVLAKDLDVYE